VKDEAEKLLETAINRLGLLFCLLPAGREAI